MWVWVCVGVCGCVCGCRCTVEVKCGGESQRGWSRDERGRSGCVCERNKHRVVLSDRRRLVPGHGSKKRVASVSRGNVTWREGSRGRDSCDSWRGRGRALKRPCCWRSCATVSHDRGTGHATSLVPALYETAALSRLKSAKCGLISIRAERAVSIVVVVVVIAGTAPSVAMTSLPACKQDTHTARGQQAMQMQPPETRECSPYTYAHPAVAY